MYASHWLFSGLLDKTLLFCLGITTFATAGALTGVLDMQANQAPTAEGDKASAENLTAEELLNSLAAGSQQESEPTEQEEVTEDEQSEEATEEITEEVTDEEATEEESEESESEEEEDSNEIDLLSLSPEQIKELAKKGKSRLLERIGELTAQKRALQQQLEEFGSKEQAPEVPQENNPFKDITSVADLKAKRTEWQKTLETTDALLEEYEDFQPDDVITVGNQEFTKRQIRQANRNAKDAITKYLPAQAEHLQRLESYKVASTQWNDTARQEVPEIMDEKSDVGKAFKALVDDPLVKKLKEKLPELGVQIEYILAHAARSKFGKSKSSIAQGAGSKLKVKPPASPVGAGAAKGGGKTTQAKYKDLVQKFERTGRMEDWLAAEAIKNS